MAKLLLLFVGIIALASVLCFAQEYEEDGSAPMTEVPPHHTVAPTPSPTPTKPPKIPPEAIFHVKDAQGRICIKLNVSMEFYLTYTHNMTKNNTVTLELMDAHVDTNKSFCNMSGPGSNQDHGQMTVVWGSDSKYMNTLKFIFLANAAANPVEWKLDNITIAIPVAGNNLFTPPPQNHVGKLEARYEDDMGFVSSTQSYLCVTERNMTMTVNSNTNHTYFGVIMNIRNFQAQAFSSINETTHHEFGAYARCPADIRGSKIVPIAVGAALAGLVIIVLIAYIIGRLRSRKQGSYEALS